MGLELRPAVGRDVDQIADLLEARGEPADAVDLRLMVDDIGLDGVGVVVDGTRVVSTASLLDETLRVRYPGGELELAAGQVELVATDTEYEGRGLVRCLMGWAHDRSAERGHDVQVMIGIPYFYRLFGYEYAIDIPPARGVRELPAADATVVVRSATVADVQAIDRLHDGAQAAADVSMPRSPAEWRWVLGGDSSTTWVAERDGSVVAACRASGDEAVVVTELAAVDRSSADALVHRIGGQAVAARPSVAALWDDLLEPHDGVSEQYYVRLPDVRAVLDRFRPAFTARLRAAGVDRSGRHAVVSTFGAHYRMEITADGGVGPVDVGGPMQAPGAAGGCGVAPDVLPALLTGPLGMHGLSRRRADVYPAGDAELYETLFPPQTADLLTWYLPY